MANNILDKSAMEAIAKIEAELPHIISTLNTITTKQESANRAIHEISKRQVGFSSNFSAIDGKFDAIEKAIVEIPQKCPHREAIARCSDAVESMKDCDSDRKDLRKEIGTVKEDISSLKTSDRIYGGGSALFTVAFNALMQFLKSGGST